MNPVIFMGVLALCSAEVSAVPIDFNRDVRPILNRNCTACHGGVKQAGEVSFIYREQALAKGESGLPTVVPGKPDVSEMIRRILLSADDDEAMPPAKHHEARLTDEEVATLRAWISEGAEWGEHWAFVNPEAKELPEVAAKDWPVSRIDHFVLSQIESLGMRPSPEAAPSELLRRVNFALTGLPPEPDDLRGFESAKLEAKVDELLASPTFGENLATLWLDVARYADSKGYEKDSPWTIWPYRDWVVKAFNEDMPYDQFLIRQIAGDLLPGATLDDVVATGFLRCSQTNDEGGTDDEEFRVMALLDRIATVWTGTQGMTFQCVQCHSHPYDPFPHEEFYQFAYYLNNTRDCDVPDDYPKLKVPVDQASKDRVMALRAEEAELSRMLLEPFGSLEKQTDWQARTPEHFWSDKPQAELGEGTLNGQPAVIARGNVATNSTYEVVFGREGGTVAAIRVFVPMPEGASAHTPAEAFAVTGWQLRIRREGNHLPESPYEKLDIAFVAGDEADGYYQGPRWGAFPNQFYERSAVLVVDKPVVLGPGDRLSLVLEQNQGRDGGKPPVLRQFSIATSDSPEWQELLGEEFRSTFDRLAAARKQWEGIPGEMVPVIEQRSEFPRVMAVFNRGDFMNKTEVVTAGMPGIFSNRLEGGTRLDAAKWLAARDNPLAARVMVNRIWEHLFGTGLVETLEDFGSTGTAPSHPDLLDDLAVRFMDEHHWSVKSLVREMVLSRTFRQSARADEAAMERDPRNRHLARGPRQRLSAEMLRDHALSVSGLLSPQVGGPPAMPPQPDGLWQVVYSGASWETPPPGDPARYRRAVYTFWRRSSPYPAFQTFDAPERRSCSARRIDTNTPLQALIPLNDPVYMEASQALARSIGGLGDEAAQIAEAYLRATSQEADSDTLGILRELLETLKADFEAAPEDAAKLGDSPAAAAMTVVCNTILNLDSSLTW